MNGWGKVTLLVSGVVLAAILLVGAFNRAGCWWYGLQTERDTRYRPFVGCMVNTSNGWFLRSEIRTGL